MTDPLRHTTTYSYDGSGVTPPAETTTVWYDPAVKPAPLSVTTYSYDASGLGTLGRPRGDVTTYEYGGKGGPAGEDEPPAPDVVVDPDGD